MFYGVPENAHFYAELVNMLVNTGDSGASIDGQLAVESNAIITTLYNRFDALKLERLVGTKRVGRMIHGDKETFMFA